MALLRYWNVIARSPTVQRHANDRRHQIAVGSQKTSAQSHQPAKNAFMTTTSSADQGEFDRT
jgi:hypothetical protein